MINPRSHSLLSSGLFIIGGPPLIIIMLNAHSHLHLKEVRACSSSVKQDDGVASEDAHARLVEDGARRAALARGLSPRTSSSCRSCRRHHHSPRPSRQMLTLPSVPIPPAARLRQKYCGTKALLSIVRAKADMVVGIRERTKNTQSKHWAKSRLGPTLWNSCLRWRFQRRS